MDGEPMELLDFKQIFERLQHSDTKGTITVYLYSKVDEAFTVYGGEGREDFVAHLKAVRAAGTVGEMFYRESDLLVCIGDVAADAMVLRADVAKAAAGIHKIIYDESEVVFADSQYTADAVYAFALASYCYDFLLKKPAGKRLRLNAPKHAKAVSIAAAQNFARFLGDTPANMMTPTLFVRYAEALLDGEGVDIKAFDSKYMRDNGMDLLLSVSQGSAEEPRLLHLRYMGRPEERVDVALVGKGVTFDTGGISIKPSANMAAMKYDMMGAATLLAAFKLVVSLALPINITATFPLVENMPGSRATKPGDVFRSMSGLTVEVDNTDAEGRLILADAMTFAQRDRPEYLFDAATLTGAMCVALGNVYGGFFTNDERLAELIYRAGVDTNEPLWRMPLSSFYRDALKSHVADLNNMGGPGAGSAKAAEFLHAFVEQGVKWAHFDIAGLMNKSYNTGLYGEESTGRPVPAFLEIIERLCE
ncbi:hypothetical protein PAPHI01_0303 [Pancytospora philotis]|nr:hypothetical protein PAPHI01_0303 [Pancytospora philotis]